MGILNLLLQYVHLLRSMRLRKRLKFCTKKCISNGKFTDLLVVGRFGKHDDRNQIELHKRPQQRRLTKLPCSKSAYNEVSSTPVVRRYTDRERFEHKI